MYIASSFSCSITACCSLTRKCPLFSSDLFVSTRQTSAINTDCHIQSTQLVLQLVSGTFDILQAETIKAHLVSTVSWNRTKAAISLNLGPSEIIYAASGLE